MRASKPHIRVHTQLRIYFGEPIAVVGQIEVMLGIHEVQLSSQATGSKCIVKGEAPIVFGPNCLSNFVWFEILSMFKAGMDTLRDTKSRS